MISPAEADSFFLQRLRMVEQQLRARGIGDERVLAAMAKVPRHEFAPQSLHTQAYADYPLPIGQEQTISQPYIVALMLEALALRPQDRILEVGTGSGYATALLGELASEVFSIERHSELAGEASARLRRMDYANVKVITGDGSQGFAPAAPYDAILVSAAAESVPSALLAQMAEEGRMVIPVGPADSQQLQVIRMSNGQPELQLRELCRFVPLVLESDTPHAKS